MTGDDLASILSRTVETKAEYDLRLLAQQLGTNYRSLMYWLRGDRPVPAHLLPQICSLLRNYEALDFLEQAIARDPYYGPALAGSILATLLQIGSRECRRVMGRNHVPWATDD